MFFQEIIEEELNVKKVTFTDDVRDFTSYSFKPQLRTLGKRFGKQLGALKEVLANLDGNKAMDSLNETGKLTITLDKALFDQVMTLLPVLSKLIPSDSDNEMIALIQPILEQIPSVWAKTTKFDISLKLEK